MSNLYGDIELDARGMRALAHSFESLLSRELSQNCTHPYNLPCVNRGRRTACSSHS